MKATREISHLLKHARLYAAVMLLGLVGLLWMPEQGAEAADSSGSFAVFGSGNLSCQRWLDDRRTGAPSAAQSEMWVAGFLSAYNHYVYKDHDVTDRFDGDYLLEWLDDYCRKRSPNQLHVAAHELVQMLRRRR